MYICLKIKLSLNLKPGQIQDSLNFDNDVFQAVWLRLVKISKWFLPVLQKESMLWEKQKTVLIKLVKSLEKQ